MTNRHLLLILAGLGGLTVLLCLVLVWRESSNSASINELRADLRSARQLQEKQHGELRDELKTTRDSLTKTEGRLQQAKRELNQAQQALADYKAKPWLNRPGKQEPWKAEFDVLNKRLVEVEKKLTKAVSAE